MRLAWDATESDVERGIVLVVYIILMDGVDDFLDTDGPVVVDACLLCPFQIGSGTILDPTQGYLVVVETDSTDSASRITVLADFATRGILTQQTAAGLLVDIDIPWLLVF